VRSLPLVADDFNPLTASHGLCHVTYMDDGMDAGEILSRLSDWLRFQGRLGLDTVPRSPAVNAFLGIAEEGVLSTHESALRVAEGEPRTQGAPPENLSDARALLGECRRCGLHRERTSIVYGEGPENARLLLVGEAPGREEDLQGRPFVGRSGELLTKMLRAIDFSRNDVYITSVVKCRPPLNRAPKPEEMAACSPFLLEQIRLIAPPLILALGQTAAHALLQEKGTIGSLRGRFHQAGAARVMVTYHPAYLLRFSGGRQQLLKREAWQDLQLLQKAYAALI
jgi:uracil-DNA glycosylase family 4